MRVLICGSRSWTDDATILKVIDGLPDGSIVIQGGAKGADARARHFAQQRGLFVAEIAVDASHWTRYGKRAGLLRNSAMLDLSPDRVIAFQRDGSRGTQYTIDEARRRGVPVTVWAA